MIDAVIQKKRRHQIGANIQLIHIDTLPFAGSIAMLQSGHQSGHAEEWDERIADNELKIARIPIRPTHEIRHTAHPLCKSAKSETSFVRSILSEQGDADHDDIGLDFCQLFISQSPFVHCSRNKILNYHVGFRDQALHQFRTFGVIEIDIDRILIAIIRRPIAAVIDRLLPTLVRGRGSDHIRMRAAFDANNFGAKVPQAPRQRGAGQYPTEIDYSNAFQCFSHSK